MARTEPRVRKFLNCFTGREWKEKTFKIPEEEQKDDDSQKKFRVDGWNEEIGDKAVWEYDGREHYTDINRIDIDTKRRKYFKSKKIHVVVIPFYCVGDSDHCVRLSESFVRARFLPLFQNQKELEAAVKKYKKELDSSPCGWQGTYYRIKKFHEKGKERFLKEMKELPEDVKHQIIYSIRLDAVQNSALLLNKEYYELRDKNESYKSTAIQKEIKELILHTDLNKKYYEGRCFKLDK